MNDTNKIAYFEAYANDDYAESPRFAKLLVTSDFLDRLEDRARLCSEQGLKEVVVVDGPDHWGDEGWERVARLRLAELHVTSEGSFYFMDSPKESAYDIQTRPLDISALRQAIQGPNKVLYFSHGSECSELSDFALTLRAGSDAGSDEVQIPFDVER